MAKSAKTRTIARQIPNRTAREDGEATRERIVETAGRIFAEKGYAATTSKDICEEAGTNIAAVNYYFGSREGLYMEVINRVHSHLFNLAQLTELSNSDLDPRRKLERFIESFVATIMKSCCWPVRIWAKESFSPSGLSLEMLETESTSRFELVARIVGDIVKIPVDAPQLRLCVLAVMSPFMSLLTISRTLPTPHQSILKEDPDKVAEQLKDFIFAGLDAVAAKYSKYRELESERRKEPVMSASQDRPPK